MSARARAIHGNEMSGERRANLELKSECPALVKSFVLSLKIKFKKLPMHAIFQIIHDFFYCVLILKEVKRINTSKVLFMIWYEWMSSLPNNIYIYVMKRFEYAASSKRLTNEDTTYGIYSRLVNLIKSNLSNLI